MEFPLKTKKSNTAEIKLSKRYPEKGVAINTVAEMTVYILKGKTILNLNNKKVLLEKGTVALIKPDQKYYWVPKPSVTLLIFSTPPWKAEQQKIIV
jgi:hypothetical protein